MRNRLSDWMYKRAIEDSLAIGDCSECGQPNEIADAYPCRRYAPRWEVITKCTGCGYESIGYVTFYVRCLCAIWDEAVGGTLGHSQCLLCCHSQGEDNYWTEFELGKLSPTKVMAADDYRTYTLA